MQSQIPPNSISKSSSVQQCDDSRKEVNDSLLKAWRFYFAEDYNNILLSYYKPISSVLQNGPRCGLVALSMASQLFLPEPINDDYIFNKAKELNFTKTGEIFSVENMLTLASTLFLCQAQVITDLMHHKSILLHHLLSGWPLLIPYDADRNHVPCCRKGHSAHWAVITGICIAVPRELLEEEFLDHEIYHVNDGSHLIKMLDDADKVLVYAHHGKSKYLAAWDLDELLNSNNNMFELDNKHNAAEIILPCDVDVLGGLRDKAVILCPFK